MTINSGGLFYQNNGYRTSITTLNMTGGTISSGATGDANGNLSLNATWNATSDAAGNAATITAGTISINTGNTLNVSRGTGGAAVDMLVDSVIMNYTGNTSPLTKTGSGVLELAGANIYTSGTVIDAGILMLGNSAGLGASTGGLTMNSGTLDMNANSLGVGGLSGTGMITDIAGSGANDQLTIGNGNANNTTFGGTLANGSGTISLSKAGSGTQVLSGSNNYSGGTFLQGGELGFTSSAALPFSTTSPNINFLGGALKWVGNSTDVSAGIALTTATTQNVILDVNGNNVTFGTGISGSGGLTLASPSGGTLNLTVANSFSGTTSITGGTLNVAHANALVNSTVNVTNNNSITFPSSLATANFGALMGSGNIGLNNTYLTVGGNGASTTYSGVLSGGSGLAKTGTGTLLLPFANNYGGPTVVQGGVLKLGGVVAGLWEGMVSSTNGDDFTDAIPHTSVQLSARWGASTNNGGANVYPSWGTNTTWGYAGYFYVPTAGIYTFGKNFDDNGYLKIDGSTLINDTNYAANISTTDSLTAGWHTIDVRFGQVGGNVGPTAGTADVGGFGIGFELPGSTTWSQFADPGNATLLAAQLAGLNVLPTNTALTVVTGATLDLNGGTQTVLSLSDSAGVGGGTVQNSGTATSLLTLSGTTGVATTYSGLIGGTGGLGNLSLTVSGNGSLQNLSGSNNYTGGTRIAGGTLQLGNAAALGSGGVTANAGVLDLNGLPSVTVPSLSGSHGVVTTSASNTLSTLSIVQSTATNFGGSFQDGAGQFALVFNGSNGGAITLAGSSNYSGGTTITAGTVEVANNSALGSTAGALTINNGSLLDMNGYHIGVAALSGGGTIDNLDGALTPSLTAGYNNASSTFSGTIQNTLAGSALALYKTGTGTLVLTGTNTYSGGTFLNGGVLNFALSSVFNLGQLHVRRRHAAMGHRQRAGHFGGLRAHRFGSNGLHRNRRHQQPGGLRFQPERQRRPVQDGRRPAHPERLEFLLRNDDGQRRHLATGRCQRPAGRRLEGPERASSTWTARARRSPGSAAQAARRAARS